MGAKISRNPGYHKGDQHAGGGGTKGGGGKRQKPYGHWEKGDLVRDVDLEHPGRIEELKIRPSRKRAREYVRVTGRRNPHGRPKRKIKG